jgi:hypothetical protein
MKTFPAICLFLSTVLVLPACSNLQNPATPPQPSSQASAQQLVATEPFSYNRYAEILERYVNADGFVDYQGLQTNAEALKAFNTALGDVTTETYAAWSDAEKIAFLINAYNAFTLESIIDQNPLKPSIKDIPGVWRIRRFDVAGQSKTLDDIEHQMLRQQFSEPRVHAALNCTAISCPTLRIEPYTAEQLDAQLDDQVRRWLSSPQGLQIDRTNNRVSISAIFDWFGEDWIPQYGVETGFTGNEKQRATLNFISQYISPENADYLRQGNYQLSYLEYDWRLNIQ